MAPTAGPWRRALILRLLFALARADDYTHFDHNGDGIITAEELAAGKGVKSEETEEWVADWDENGDGGLDADEWSAALHEKTRKSDDDDGEYEPVPLDDDDDGEYEPVPLNDDDDDEPEDDDEENDAPQRSCVPLVVLLLLTNAASGGYIFFLHRKQLPGGGTGSAFEMRPPLAAADATAASSVQIVTVEAQPVVPAYSPS